MVFDGAREHVGKPFNAPHFQNKNWICWNQSVTVTIQRMFLMYLNSSLLNGGVGFQFNYPDCRHTRSLVFNKNTKPQSLQNEPKTWQHWTYLWCGNDCALFFRVPLFPVPSPSNRSSIDSDDQPECKGRKKENLMSKAENIDGRSERKQQVCNIPLYYCVTTPSWSGFSSMWEWENSKNLLHKHIALFIIAWPHQGV